MKKVLIAALVICGLFGSSVAIAGQAEFCAGFEQGFRTIAGNMAMLPMCPIAPVTPIGSTDFQEGIRAGIAAAYAQR